MVKLLRLPDVKARTGLSRSAIYDRIAPKSKRFDPTFPRPVQLGARAVGWVEDEVDRWLASRIAASRSQLTERVALDRTAMRRNPRHGEAK